MAEPHDADEPAVKGHAAMPTNLTPLAKKGIKISSGMPDEISQVV
jgi:hypothetical protein